ncbi:MAG TPA: DegV family protein [Anaerolineales bacterium]|nr:DegV family protein [Anaerolineales bacterium]
MLRIVTDGAADMPSAWEKEFEIDVIPINIQFGEQTYLQYVDLDNDGFYKKVEETKTIPKTSQPSPHQFVEFYKKVAKPGDTILSIHITSKLSGTYASAVQAADELKGTYDVIPVDSMVGSVAIGFMCREARKLERNGKSVGEIVKVLEAVRGRVRVYLTLDTLEYAKMSGRVGAMQAALASLMNVKPIAVLTDGVLNMTEKVRTRKASVSRLIAMAEEEYGTTPVFLGVVQANDRPSGMSLLEQARGHFKVVGEPVLTDLSISVAANLGPGTVGLVLYPAEP